MLSFGVICAFTIGNLETTYAQEEINKSEEQIVQEKNNKLKILHMIHLHLDKLSPCY